MDEALKKAAIRVLTQLAEQGVKGDIDAMRAEKILATCHRIFGPLMHLEAMNQAMAKNNHSTTRQ